MKKFLFLMFAILGIATFAKAQPGGPCCEARSWSLSGPSSMTQNSTASFVITASANCTGSNAPTVTVFCHNGNTNHSVTIDQFDGVNVNVTLSHGQSQTFTCSNVWVCSGNPDLGPGTVPFTIKAHSSQSSAFDVIIQTVSSPHTIGSPSTLSYSF